MYTIIIISLLSLSLVGGCGQLESPVNGKVHLSGTNIGDTATYTCQQGFTLNGSPLRVCDTDGQWTNSQPTCDLITQCTSLIDPPNGKVSISGGSGQGVGSSAEYACDEGFILEGNQRRLCLRTGEWTGTDPLCRGMCVV